MSLTKRTPLSRCKSVWNIAQRTVITLFVILCVWRWLVKSEIWLVRRYMNFYSSRQTRMFLIQSLTIPRKKLTVMRSLMTVTVVMQLWITFFSSLSRVPVMFSTGCLVRPVCIARHSPASLALVRSGSVLVLIVHLTWENNAAIQGHARPVVT